MSIPSLLVGRRAIWSATALAGAAMASRAGAEPASVVVRELRKEADHAAVYHCDFGEPQRFAQMLNNINNHLGAYEFDPFKIKIVIVAHAAGVKFFLRSLLGTPWEKDTIDPEIGKRQAALAQYGVEAWLCRMTFSRLKIDTAAIGDQPWLRMVPSGVATVAELQGRGFGYVKIG